jgi:hypothetical protein
LGYIKRLVVNEDGTKFDDIFKIIRMAGNITIGGVLPKRQSRKRKQDTGEPAKMK